MPALRLSKHHGLGNDFLVYLDPGRQVPLTAELARALCDRHTGVGADGLIRLIPDGGGVAASMELRNADGGAAEISGNGLRCAAQALTGAGVVAPGEIVVATAAGDRRLEVSPGDAASVVYVKAEMGRPTVLGEASTWVGGDVKSALRVDVGNPHLVLLVADATAVDVRARGPVGERSVPGGVNVEFVTPGPGAGELTLRTWERGSGETLACGSGSCAAATAARVWGLVDDRVVVLNPGGALAVAFDHDGAVTLAGPAQLVAVVEVDPEHLGVSLDPAVAGGGASPA